jgi:hypothetical protein
MAIGPFSTKIVVAAAFIPLLPMAEMLVGFLAFSGALSVLGPNAEEGVRFAMQTALTLLLLVAGLTTAEVVFGPKRPAQ